MENFESSSFEKAYCALIAMNQQGLNMVGSGQVFNGLQESPPNALAKIVWVDVEGAESPALQARGTNDPLGGFRDYCVSVRDLCHNLIGARQQQLG